MRTITRISRHFTPERWPLLLILVLPCITATSQAGHYRIEIYKSSQALLVKDGEQTIRQYRVASGKGGQGTKRQMGDNKTPTGKYKIIELRDNSRFHFFMQINYPNTLDAWYGYRNDLIDGKEFRNIVEAISQGAMPPQDTPLGGYIGLHGIGEVTNEKLDIHGRHDWTEGCIALTNEEISELRDYIDIGTTIIIND